MNSKLAVLIAESGASDAEIIEFIHESKNDPITVSIGACFLKDSSVIRDFIIEVGYDPYICSIVIPMIKELWMLDRLMDNVYYKSQEVFKIALETKVWRENLLNGVDEIPADSIEESKNKVYA